MLPANRGALRDLLPFLTLACSLASPPVPAGAQTTRIGEEVRSIRTYPFSEPNPIPILAKDARLYPYHTFDGYAADAVPRDWKVVKLENEWIEVSVLPEVGGKVWGAVVKSTGHEFIYRNEVLKFRNIALRGPWTSGGIEFNFGVIGHTPSTATPVDYRLATNPDGSVSCWVGGMDLPSRTHWRVEVRLPADKAAFETNVTWSNPTPLEQPYYNWMTGAAFARGDLELFVPGNAYLGHPGERHDWPVDPEGRYLPLYRNNTFASHKSYHVVGELHDFFGGYYHDDGWGFGHWARHEEMPGQKIWLWALSPEGGVWEDLLTDTDGQYVEFQAGRLLVQYSPDPSVNPITQAAFDPGASSRWSETWFPVEGIGGISDASDSGALHFSLTPDGTTAVFGVNAFVAIRDTLQVWVDGELTTATPVSLRPLEPFEAEVPVRSGARVRVRMPALDLEYDSDPSDRRLSRPFETDPVAFSSLPESERKAFEARELLKGRWYAQARSLFGEVLVSQPWSREALLGLSELDYRSGLHTQGLERAQRALQLDTYDARANFLAGLHHRALGHVADARDAFGWAARSTEYTAVAHTQLAAIMLEERRWSEATRYARLALDHDRNSVPAWRVLCIVARLDGDTALAGAAQAELWRLDPLGHAALAEEHLARLTPASAQALAEALSGEYPDQTLLELALAYVDLGLTQDALTLLALPTGRPLGAEAQAWRAWLFRDPALLLDAGSPAFQFPYRRESLAVLEWADEQSDAWIWTHLRALNLWAVDRADEAAGLMVSLDDAPDYAPAYASRGLLLKTARGTDAVPDLRRAVEMDPESRVLHVALAQELHAQGRWDVSLEALTTARRRFPGDFNLALLEVRALLEVGRAAEAARILDGLRVLPSENARESHRLFEWAHTLLGLDALERGDPAGAREQLATALTWPESLGQGRPYEPEERLPRFLLGVAEQRLGNDSDARGHFRHVVDATAAAADRDAVSRLDLLAIPAELVLGAAPQRQPAAPTTYALFQDLEGRILRRALELGGAR